MPGAASCPSSSEWSDIHSRDVEPGGAAVCRAPPFAARMAAAGPARMAAVAAAEAEGSSSDDVEPPRALDRALPVEPERDADG